MDHTHTHHTQTASAVQIGTTLAAHAEAQYCGERERTQKRRNARTHTFTHNFAHGNARILDSTNTLILRPNYDLKLELCGSSDHCCCCFCFCCASWLATASA